MRILYLTANPQYALARMPPQAVDDAAKGAPASGAAEARPRPAVRKYDKLDLWPELRNVTDVLFDARAEGFIELEVVPEVTRKDVVRYINARRPNIVHFSGHGEKDELVLSGARAGELVSVDWLRGALAEKDIDVLVLNCCWSDSLAEQLKDEVDLIVGTSMPVGSRESAEFSRVFYDELQNGATLGEAFNAATKDFGEGENALYRSSCRDASVLKRALPLTEEADTDSAKGAPARDTEEPTPAQQILAYETDLQHKTDRLWVNVAWDLLMIVIAFQIAFIAFGVINGVYEDHFKFLAGLVPHTPLAYLFDRMATMHEFIAEWAPWLQWEPFAVLAALVGNPTARLVSYLWLGLGASIAKRVLRVIGMLPEARIRKELATGRIQTIFKRLAEYEQ